MPTTLLGYFIILFAYLLGSINSAIIVCFIFKLPSPRTVGSGNPGTTNVLRIGGKRMAFITLCCDFLKGFLPVIIAYSLNLSSGIISIIAVAAVIGHIFPIFFGFKGGKGVATFIGVLFGFYWILGLIFIITWFVTAMISKYSSLSALLAIIVSTIAIIYIYWGISFVYAPFIILAVILILKHHQNIKRLLTGQESKIGEKG